jgi:hypothetical protein
MPLSADQRARIQATFAKYLLARAKNAEKLSLADLKFNVVHLRTVAPMLGLSTPLDLIPGCRLRASRADQWDCEEGASGPRGWSEGRP